MERFREQMLATARRYSAGPHDAEDAYQRAAEIVLARQPTGTEEELCRWVRTTVKHEALAIRRQQRRTAPAGDAVGDREPAGPDISERAERSERLRLGAQALSLLKPQEIRCLILRARGFSYREICEETGWSYTKVNRSITEGRRAFTEKVASIESGLECRRLAPHLSALADGEADTSQLRELRPHLRSCLACRARLREYRTVPSRVAALAPPALLAVGDGGPGPVRAFLESSLGAAQDRAAAIGDRAHQAAEMMSAQKAVAVAASAAALAGGGAVGADRLSERLGGGDSPAAEVRKAAAQQAQDTPPAAPTPDPPIVAPVPEQPAAGPAPGPSPTPEPQPAPPPAAPVNEFGPEPAPVPSAAQAPPPSPAPTPARSGGGGGEFTP
ncbi:MAG TPA: sigma-70 family RNA polymerase sigma factor [Thermoleophilaceae bacterium]|nr:sigma-70 family RNA polymerase sigma factor [Thermoleophilaceae bacterium]